MRKMLYLLTLATLLISASCGQSQPANPPSSEPGKTAMTPPKPAEPAKAAQSAPAKEPAKPAEAPKPAPPKPEAPKPAPKAAPPKLAVAGPSLVQNGSFEQPAKDAVPCWRVPEGVSASLDSETKAFDGKYSIKVELAGDVNLGIIQSAKAESGRWYMLRGWIKTEDLAGKACLEVQDGEKGFKAFRAVTNGITGTAEWTPVSTQFQVPQGTAALNLFLRRPDQPDAKDNKGTVWFDRCELMPMALFGGPNMLGNAGFEVGEKVPDVWSEAPEKVKASLVSTGQFSGKKCLEVTLAGDVNLGMRQVVDVKPGVTYSLTGYVKCKGLTGNAWLEVSDAEKGWESFAAHSDGVTGTQEWTPLSLVFTVPDEVKKVNVVLRRPAEEKASKGKDKGKSKDKQEGTIWFDNYALFELTK